MQCCSASCANALRARGRPPQPGELTRREVGSKTAYKLEWGRRRAMPQWAAWWEQQRRAEDLAEISQPLIGGPCSSLRARPKTRSWIAGICPGCGETVVVIRGWWHDSIRCPACTKAKWRLNHRKRAQYYGVAYEHIENAAVFASDGYRCQLCGCKTTRKHPHPRSPTLDHIIPMSKGGPHLRYNVQTACFDCNMRKHSGAANDQLRLAV
jgi:hypothetical protein